MSTSFTSHDPVRQKNLSSTVKFFCLPSAAHLSRLYPRRGKGQDTIRTTHRSPRPDSSARSQYIPLVRLVLSPQQSNCSMSIAPKSSSVRSTAHEQSHRFRLCRPPPSTSSGQTSPPIRTTSTSSNSLCRGTGELILPSTTSGCRINWSRTLLLPSQCHTGRNTHCTLPKTTSSWGCLL